MALPSLLLRCLLIGVVATWSPWWCCCALAEPAGEVAVPTQPEGSCNQCEQSVPTEPTSDTTPDPCQCSHDVPEVGLLAAPTSLLAIQLDGAAAAAVVQGATALLADDTYPLRWPLNQPPPGRPVTLLSLFTLLLL
ncbi:MAG: hypothetical protein OER86_09035 [Phycisphaerae bacterium]|nr:hypothetical protein [Phycisphaerae bacterium]